MEKYEQIKNAMKIFGLKEDETIVDIKRKINNLIIKWHPDKCPDNEKQNIYLEKSILLIEAKKLIMDYCENFKISFKKDEVEKYENQEEFWKRHFGNDPHWGNINKHD